MVVSGLALAGGVVMILLIVLSSAPNTLLLAAALTDHQQAAIELGFLHHRYLRGTPPDHFAGRGQAHLARTQPARPDFSFSGQVVPAR